MIKEFKLGGVTWSVNVDRERMDIEECIGLTVHNEQTIYLTDRYKGQRIEPDSIDQTLYHEVVHAILDTLGYCELSSDETFVHSFSTLLHQFEMTKTN